MNVIDYITITCNLKNVRLQITFDYMKSVIDYNRLRLQITITPCLEIERIQCAQHFSGIILFRYAQSQKIFPDYSVSYNTSKACKSHCSISMTGDVKHLLISLSKIKVGMMLYHY